MQAKQSGFTAIEILFAAAIIGILSALAIKPIGGLIKRIRIQNTVEGVKHLIITARSRAIANPSIHCGVFFDVTAGSQKVQAFLDNNNPTSYTYSSGQDSTYLRPYLMQNNVVMSVPSGQFNTIVFRGDGSANQSTTIYFTLGTFLDTLNVLASTGRVKAGVK